MDIKEKIKSNEKLKKLILWMLMPRNQGRPRFWVKLVLNPLKHKKGKRTLIRRCNRMDVLPFHNFEVGKDSTIEDFSTISNVVGDVLIGDRTRIGIGDVVIGPVNIGNDVIFAQNVILSGLNHGYEDISIPIRLQKVETKPIIVEDEVWIGANAVVTAGITIGKHSIVAAGCVVVKDVPPYSIVGGNPGRLLKQYNHETKAWERVKK